MKLMIISKMRAAVDYEGCQSQGCHGVTNISREPNLESYENGMINHNSGDDSKFKYTNNNKHTSTFNSEQSNNNSTRSNVRTNSITDPPSAPLQPKNLPCQSWCRAYNSRPLDGRHRPNDRSLHHDALVRFVKNLDQEDPVAYLMLCHPAYFSVNGTEVRPTPTIPVNLELRQN